MNKELDLTKLHFDYSFKINGVDELIIRHFNNLSTTISDKEAKITSKEIIDNLVKLIGELPNIWDMYKQLSEDRDYIVLYFLWEKNNYFIEIYDTMIMTPDSSLITVDNSSKDKIIEIVNKLIKQ